MALYKYIDQTGQSQSVEADSPEIAIANSPNRAGDSGVQLVQPSQDPIPVPTQEQVAPQPPVEPEATAGDLGPFIPQESFDPYAEERTEYQRIASGGDDEKTARDIRRQVQKQFRGQIQATRDIYNDQLREAFQEGQGRVGSTRAIQARGGLLGSDFGAAQQEKVTGFNSDIRQGIQAEQAAAIAAIMGEGDRFAAARIKERTEAIRQGAKANLEYLKGADERRNAGVSSVVAALIAKGIDVENMSPKDLEEMAKKYQTTSQDILAKYDEAQAEDTEAKDGRTARQKDYEYAVDQGYEGSFQDYNKKSTGGLTPYQQFTATQSIAKDTQTRTANAREMTRQSNLIQNSYQNILDGGDRSLNTQAIVVSFNKILDPTSVVRESEYDRTAAGQALINKLKGKVDNIVAGGAGITENTLKEANDIAQQYIQGAKDSINEQNIRAQDMADSFGLNPDFVTSAGFRNEGPQQVTPDEQQAVSDLLNEGYSQEDVDAIYGRPMSFNKGGNLPQRNNNPGNIKSGGLADEFATGTDEQGHLIFPDAQTGFMAMQKDVEAKVNGNSRHIGANPTIAELGSVYAEDPNWGNAVASILGLDPNTPTQSIPISTLTEAIATQEGFYA